MLIKRKLSLLVPNLLSRDGKELVTGGLERYVWQLLALARQMAFSVDVHQYGDSDWEKEVDGIKIKGYGLAALSPEAALQEMHFNTRRVLYASILLNPVSYKPGAAAISHGVWWDGGNAAEDYICAMFKLCRRALQEAETVVSCDYNFLNVMRAAYPLLASKIKVIPNYADPEFFGPPLKVVRDTINILYPRRLDYCRGGGPFFGSRAGNPCRLSASTAALSCRSQSPAFKFPTGRVGSGAGAGSTGKNCLRYLLFYRNGCSIPRC